MLIAFLLAAVAQPAAEPIPDHLAQLSIDWGICRGRTTLELAPSRQTPEQVADAVVARCEPYLERLAVAGIAHYGPSWRSDADALRSRSHAEALRDVRDQRSGVGSSNPTTAWGQCLGRRAHIVNAARDRGAAIDRAFAECSSEEETARSRIAAATSPERADAQIQTLRRLARERLFQPGGTQIR